MINKLKAIWNKKRKLSDFAINCAFAQLVLVVLFTATGSVIAPIVGSISATMFICTALILMGLEK